MDNSRLDSIEQKLDIIIALLNNKGITKNKKWSFEEYSDKSIIIKFTFDESFKNYIKEIGGTWIATKKGWMFPKSELEKITILIKNQFSDWEIN
jgi:hypothetical protein